MINIYLRPATENDGSIIVKWRNSDKVRRHCMTKKMINEELNLAFFNTYVVSGKYKQFIVERIEENTGIATYPIATVYLKDIDNENKRCELCIFTSDDEEWDEEGQIIAIRLLLERAFNEYGMHKVYTFVFNKYQDEVGLMKRAGFKVEAVLKEEAMSLDGIYEDVMRLCVIKPNETSNQQ